MRKLLQTLRIALALFLTVFSANIVPAAAAYADSNGNNGTLKVHEQGDPIGTPSNNPQVCVFNFEAFGLDASQTGDIVITNQSPTTPAGQTALTLSLSTDATGYGSSPNDNDSADYINAAGSPYQLPNGHYKATLDNKFGTDPDGKAKSKVIWVSCAGTPTPTSVTPAVTVVDECGTANDSVTGIAVDGIDYTYAQSGLTYTVTATAEDGYILDVTGAQGWVLNMDGSAATYTTTLTDTACAQITPIPPQINDVCGTANDSILLPESGDGVTYTQSAGTQPNTIIVTATPDADTEIVVDDSGYVLQNDGTAIYTVTFTDEPCTTEVTPTAPTSADVCSTANDTYTIPEKTGVIYQVNGQTMAAGTYHLNGAASVTVTAVAAPGYTLTGTTQWTFTFSTTPCAIACVLPSQTTYIEPWSYLGTTYPEVGAYPNGTPGTYQFVNNSSFTGLNLTTPANESYVDGLIDAGNRPLSAISTMSYKTYRDPSSTGNNQILPAYVLEIDKDGNPLTTNDTAYLFYEPIYNGTVQTGVWQTWDAYNGGNAIWWGAGDNNPDHTWNQLVAEFPTATVLAYGFNQGTYNAGANTYVQQMTFDCATTNFSAPGKGGVEPGTPPSTPAPVTTSAPKASAALPELPQTGPSELNLMPIGFLVASLLYGAVYFAQPKKWYQKSE